MWKVAMFILLPGLAGCAKEGSHSISLNYSALLERGESFYSAGNYKEAGQAFYEAAHAVEGKDDALFLKAGTRHAAAFCMTQFENAKADIAAKNFRLALLYIDTALADSACLNFDQEVQWARSQKARLEARP